MKKIIAFVLALFLVCIGVLASNASLPRLVDEADLLSDSEETVLLEKLDQISEERECDVVIVTVESLNGVEVTAAADDFYDYNYYGYGPDYDGILFLISMEERQFATSTFGFGIEAFTDYGQDMILEEVVPYLSDGDYNKAFLTFAVLCDEYLEAARNGQAYDVGNEKFSFEPMWILIALASGLVVAFIYTGTLKAQLNNVKMNNSAANYVENNSLKMAVSTDMFLYRNVTRTARPKDNGSSSGGGSSLRSSSSGRSHGGRSGSF